MSDKLRVHILSKELGVTSKAIIAKCKDEGVEGITNHMSTVSAGLAETIREWFSMGAHKTSVETSAPVDLEKVKVKRRARARKKKKEEEAEAKKEKEEEPVEVAAVLEAPGIEVSPAETEKLKPAAKVKVPKISVSKKPPKKSPVKTRKRKTVKEEVEEPTETLVKKPAKPARTAAKKKQRTKVIRPAAVAPASITQPAGPQNIPAPAQMRGPKVVGFAKPDPIIRPTPRTVTKLMVEDIETLETGIPHARKGGKRKAGREDHEGRRGRHRVSPRRSGRSTLDVGERLREWRDRDLVERQERLEAASGKGIHARHAKEEENLVPRATIAPRKTKAQVTEPIVVRELCAASGIGMNQLWPKFKSEHDLLIQRNTVIPTEMAELVMLDFGVELEIIKPKTNLDKLIEEFEERKRDHLEPRPPIVTMFGHVDHGKTSLLDMVRKTSVASDEAGGITQHTSAYRVERGDLSVTFLDTPGHEAFTSMRARGANMTDVVVLVVAADDGVMPQTVEAVNHARAANVMIVVALNKIDLPGIDLNKVYGQLAELDLAPTDWGGHTDVIKTSAVTGEGVDELITHLATLTEILGLEVDPTIPATGTVIEARLKPGIGPSAQVLVREGTLNNGDFIVCGPAAGRVRTMRDDKGRNIKKAGPGVPVEVAGLDDVPNAGDGFYCVDSLQRAKQIANEVKEKQRDEMLIKSGGPQKNLQDLLQQREEGKFPELNMILRADVQGAIDALVKALGDFPEEEVKLNLLHSGIGSVTESDVVLAEASNALIVGFNVVADGGAQRMAEAKGVDIRLYRVIYEVIEDIRKALEGLLPSEQTEETQGKATIREIFHVSRVGMIAGCMVSEGAVGRSHYVRVIRDGHIIVPTEDDVKRRRHRVVESLRRFKDDVRDVRAGMECGLRIEGFDDIKPGDVIETYAVIETPRSL